MIRRAWPSCRPTARWRCASGWGGSRIWKRRWTPSRSRAGWASAIRAGPRTGSRPKSIPIRISTAPGNIAVVHNGIIENYLALRAELEAKGHVFKSQTDTEVIPHLIEEILKAGGKSHADAIREALQRGPGRLCAGHRVPRRTGRPLCGALRQPADHRRGRGRAVHRQRRAGHPEPREAGDLSERRRSGGTAARRRDVDAAWTERR